MPHSSLHQLRFEMCLKLSAMGRALDSCLGEGFCPTPGLDMLLALYVAEHEKRATYMWSLCMATNIPFSTAHRKISLLEEQGLLVREPAVRDRRRIGVKMTFQGREAVHALLDQFLNIWNLAVPNTETGPCSPPYHADLPVHSVYDGSAIT